MIPKFNTQFAPLRNEIQRRTFFFISETYLGASLIERKDLKHLRTSVAVHGYVIILLSLSMQRKTLTKAKLKGKFMETQTNVNYSRHRHVI
jgi:hypothetical protein